MYAHLFIHVDDDHDADHVFVGTDEVDDDDEEKFLKSLKAYEK